jgi:RecA/RadA recombinase
MAFATLEEEVAVRCVKHFADIEMQRRRSETNLRAHNARERGAEDAEQEKVVYLLIACR